MNFLNPWGMLLILGLPVLVIIYLIKATRQEKKVSSTYIWKLSEKFNKKRLPVSRFNKILLFLLRLLALCLLAFLASRPVLTDFPNKDYILIIDSSASMMIPDKNGTTRFEKALSELERMADKVSYGHTVSIISASSDPYCLLKQSSSQGEIDLAIKRLSCTMGGCDLEGALQIANEISITSNSPELYIYTDISCIEGNEGERVRIVDMSSDSDTGNISLDALTYYSDRSAGICEFRGSLSSTFSHGSVVVGLRIDDKVVDAVKVELNDRENIEVFFKEKMTAFTKAEIFIEQEDAIPEDNSYFLLNYDHRDRKILLVGNSTFYLQSALSVIGNCTLTCLSSIPDDGPEEILQGYDIYIFDGISPKIIPSDGSVIFFNCEKLPGGITPSEQISSQSEAIYNSDSSSGMASRFDFNETVISKYQKLLANASWDVLLYADDNPILAIKSYQSGYTHTVFAFDLHDSNMPLKPYFIPLLNEIISFSAPELVSARDLPVGSHVDISRPVGCTSLYILDPMSEKNILDHNSTCSEFTPRDVGLYTCVAQIGEDDIEQAEFFCHIPANESIGEDIQGLPIVEYNLNGQKKTGNAQSEISFFLAVALLILLLIEWGVYYYEQY